MNIIVRGGKKNAIPVVLLRKLLIFQLASFFDTISKSYLLYLMSQKLFAFDIPIEAFYKLPSSMMIYWKNTQGKFYGCNELLAGLGGFTTNKVVGKTDYEWMSREDADIITGNDKQIIAQQATSLFLETAAFNASTPFSFISLKT